MPWFELIVPVTHSCVSANHYLRCTTGYYVLPRIYSIGGLTRTALEEALLQGSENPESWRMDVKPNERM
jgi:hypothetical protein